MMRNEQKNPVANPLESMSVEELKAMSRQGEVSESIAYDELKRRGVAPTFEPKRPLSQWSSAQLRALISRPWHPALRWGVAKELESRMEYRSDGLGQNGGILPWEFYPLAA